MLTRSFAHPDVLVVGAGIVGAACAHALARRGAHVLVIERAGIGGGATAAGMGHLVVMDDTRAEFALSAWSRALWHELAPQFDAHAARAAFTRCGTLWVAADDAEYALAHARQQAFARQRVACAVLDAHALRAAEPGLRAGLRGGLLVPDDALVYAPAVCAWLLARQPGQSGQAGQGRIACRLHTPVVRVRREGVVLANGETLAAGAVLLANGLQAAALLPGLPLQPKKGHLLITDRYPGAVRHQILETGYIKSVKSAHHAGGASVAFNVQPRPGGQLLIGSSRQSGNDDAAVEPAMLARMLRRAVGYLPALAALNAIRAWTGIRCATPDGLPLIGPADAFAPEGDGPRPEPRSVWLATGHEGLGVTTALATARLIVAQMLDAGAGVPIDAAPYLPERFAGLADVARPMTATQERADA